MIENLPMNFILAIFLRGICNPNSVRFSLFACENTQTHRLCTQKLPKGNPSQSLSGKCERLVLKHKWVAGFFIAMPTALSR